MKKTSSSISRDRKPAKCEVNTVPATEMNRAIKYRAYPTEEQAQLFAKTFGSVRFIWNQMLGDSIRFYEETDTSFIPTPAKYKKTYPFLKEVDSLALANAQLDLKGAYRKFFSEKNVGFPNFKSKKKSKNSYTTNNQITRKKDGTKVPTIELGDNYIKLPKIGKVRIAKHRGPRNGWKLKSATVERTSTDKYYISLLFEFTENIEPVSIEKSLGLDYSSHDFFVDSEGTRANYPRFYRQAEEKLAREQRRLTRMQKGSKNYEQQKLKVALIHEKISNQRKDFCHKLSRKIANSYDAVMVEDINLRGLAGSLKLGKSTNDNGFGMFRNFLHYKMEEQGKHYSVIDKWYPSSKTCHVCGFVYSDLTLDQRAWICSSCGTAHDRDHNAAINIQQFGLASFSSSAA